MIYLEVNGEKYEGFTQIRAKRSYITVPASFSFTATTSPENITQFPIQKGDACRVLINDTVFTTGHIDVITIDHSDGRHEITVEGRSLIADLVDSTMNGKYEINGPIGLIDALKKIISLSGVQGVSVLSSVENIPDFTASEKLSGDIGSNIWGFMAELAMKKNVLLTENGDGQIVLVRGGGEKISEVVTKTLFGTDNNITESQSVRSDRSRFNTYTVVSQSDSSGLSSFDDLDSFDSSESASVAGVAKDDEIRVTRVKCFHAEKSSSSNDCQSRAVWQSNISRTRGFSYTCEAVEFATDGGFVFEPGQVMHVLDEFQMVDSDLIIDSVEVSYDGSGGSKLTRKYLLPDSFQLMANEPKAKKTGNNSNTDIFS